MNHQERLFTAIGGADPYLVVRSEKQRRRRWPGYCLAAACLALVLTLGHFLPRQPEPVLSNDPPVSTPIVEEPFVPLRSGEIGTLRLLSYAPQSQEAVNFLIYVNEEQFSICEDNGLYSIRSINPLPEDFPLCGLDILHLSDTSPTEARTAAAESLEAYYADVSQENEYAVLPGSLYLRASAGVDWNSEQAELWFVDDGQGGAFVLNARYFLEAEEGLGLCFRDMVSGFRAVPPDETVPGWMRELYEAADRLFPALFSNDLSGVSDLLAENADAEAYGRDVLADVTVASVDYAPDGSETPTSAVVSVKHRLNPEESFNYLTMELSRRDGKWMLDWSGIEK